jgi:hypothetical protein
MYDHLELKRDHEITRELLDIIMNRLNYFKFISNDRKQIIVQLFYLCKQKFNVH